MSCAARSGVFVWAKFLDPLSRTSTNAALGPMSRAEPEHALARGIEGQEIRRKNNKPSPSAALDRAIHNSTSPNALAGYRPVRAS